MEKIKDWKQVYELPLRYDKYNYAWGKNNTMALLFEGLTDDEREKCIKAINGTLDFKIENLTFNDVDFFKDGEYIFCVRGWGNLTGIGGLNLPDDEAVKIQDAFVNHIFKALAKNI